MLDIYVDHAGANFSASARLGPGIESRLASRACRGAARSLQSFATAPINGSWILGGMMQRLSIARAMMHDPQVLFLDEPSFRLGPANAGCFCGKSSANTTRAVRTILLTTHNMEEADALCQRLAIIDHGRNIALGTPAELKASVPGGFLLRLRFARHSRNCCSACKLWRA